MNIKTLITVIVGFAIITGCGNRTNKTNNAIGYATTLINCEWAIYRAATDLFNTYGENNFDAAEGYRLDCVQLCDSAIHVTKKAGAFMGDGSFQLASLKYFDATKKLYTNDWEETIRLARLYVAEGNNSQQGSLLYIRLTKIVTDISTKSDKHLKDLNVAYERFAKKYNFVINKNATDKSRETQENFDREMD